MDVAEGLGSGMLEVGRQEAIARCDGRGHGEHEEGREEERQWRLQDLLERRRHVESCDLVRVGSDS